CRDRLERSGAQLEFLARGDPLIGFVVSLIAVGPPHAGLDHLLDQRLGARDGQSLTARRQQPEVPAEHYVERLLLALTQRYFHSENFAERDRLRVVVSMYVRDQKPAYVAEPGSDPG